jgi:hypothetical protein
MLRTVTLASMLLVVVAAGAALAQHAAPGGVFNGCSIHGAPNSFDPRLNDRKNRFTLPTGTISTTTIAQLIATAPKRNPETKAPRSTWKPPADKTRIEAFEGHGARIEAYMNAVIAEGPEQSNCGAPLGHGDTHVYLVDTQNAANTHAAFAEVTPRWLSANPSWTQPALHALAASGARVRITGWLMYDEEHHDMIVKKLRGTLWELHPITNIEVSTSTGWVALAVLKPSATPGMVTMAAPVNGRVVNAPVRLANTRPQQTAAKFLQQEAAIAALEEQLH